MSILDKIPTTTKALVIWQEIPENITVYQIDVTQEEMELLNACQGHYINADLNEDLVKDLLALIDRANEGPASESKLWSDRSNADAPLKIKHEGPVIITGFVL